MAGTEHLGDVRAEVGSGRDGRGPGDRERPGPVSEVHGLARIQAMGWERLCIHAMPREGT